METKTKTKRKNASIYAVSMKAAAVQWNISPHLMRVAKAEGCLAFSGSRVKKEPLLKWIKENPGAVAKGKSLAAQADLNHQKLQLEVDLLHARIKKEESMYMKRSDAIAVATLAVSVGIEEAVPFLEPDHHRVYKTRTLSRIEAVLRALT